MCVKQGAREQETRSEEHGARSKGQGARGKEQGAKRAASRAGFEPRVQIVTAGRASARIRTYEATRGATRAASAAAPQ